MAIDFPNSPTLNQIYTVGSRSWIWDGSTWNIYANVPNRYIQDAAPSSPQSGDQWFESDTGRLFVYYDSAWVEIGNATDIAGALQPKQVTDLTAITSLTTDDVFPVIDNPSSATAANKITYGDLSTAIANTLGTWTSFTPSWTNLTLGNGSVSAAYLQVNKLLFVTVKVTLGSTSSLGDPVRMTLPNSLTQDTASQDLVGITSLGDTGVAGYQGFIGVTSSTQVTPYVLNVGSTYASLNTITSTRPFTFGNTDTIAFQFVTRLA